MGERKKDLNLNKAILVFIIISFIILSVWVKILGTYFETPVERQGYCKLLYGDDWRYSKITNSCYNRFLDKEKLDEEDFKEVCLKPNILSLQVWSDCFKANKGDYIS